MVEWYGTRDGYASADPEIKVLDASPEEVLLEAGGVEARFEVSVVGDAVAVDGPTGSVQLRAVPRFVDPTEALASGSLLAPMPGSVVAVHVGDGDSVVAGSALLVLEAMKMQHTISAPTDGVVTDLVAVGAQVAAGDVLAVVSTQTDLNDRQPDRQMEDA